MVTENKAKYLVWISGQRDATWRVIEAKTGFEARQTIAREYRLGVTDACSRRIDAE